MYKHIYDCTDMVMYRAYIYTLHALNMCSGSILVLALVIVMITVIIMVILIFSIFYLFTCTNIYVTVLIWLRATLIYILNALNTHKK